MGQTLPDLLKLLNAGEKLKVDKEVEEITKMDCDKAAQKLSKEEFERVAREAVNRVKKKRVPSEKKEELTAIA